MVDNGYVLILIFPDRLYIITFCSRWIEGLIQGFCAIAENGKKRGSA